MDMMESGRVEKKRYRSKVKAMLRGVPYWIYGISQAKSSPPPALPEGDVLLEQLWIETVERRTNDKVDDVITGQSDKGPTPARPSPNSGKGHWFDHR